MLLTHTSGFSTDVPLVGADRVERMRHILAEPLLTPAGSRFRYADKNFISLGALVERLTGRRLDALAQEQITGPLGMRDTGYLPPRNTWQRVAATEGTRRGVVHDPAAAALDGVSGHAGIFATAWDLGLLTAVLVLLTNRVHPDAGWGSINPARKSLATALAGGQRPGRGGNRLPPRPAVRYAGNQLLTEPAIRPPMNHRPSTM